MKKKSIKIVICAVAMITIAAALIYSDHVQKGKKEYNDAMTKTAKDFETFISMVEDQISDGTENASFDEFTESYMQLRVRLSTWGHISADLTEEDQTGVVQSETSIAIGELGLALKSLYFDMVHMYYIKDAPIKKDQVEEKVSRLKGMMEYLSEPY